MTGRIKRLDRSWGFIRDEEGRSFFFHESAVSEASVHPFEQLLEGDHVSFEPVAPQPDRGPQAIEVVWQR